jgi:hypothetical protein
MYSNSKVVIFLRSKTFIFGVFPSKVVYKIRNFKFGWFKFNFSLKTLFHIKNVVNYTIS